MNQDRYLAGDVENLHLMPDPSKNELVNYVAGPQLYINQSLAQPD